MFISKPKKSQMHQVRFLCLAVGRRDGGSCIAGIDLDSGRWVRPVHPQTHGALADHELIVRDGETLKMMAPLDVLQLRLGAYAGSNAQPENWDMACLSDAESPSILCRFGGPDRNRLLTFLNERGPLFTTYGDAIAAADLQSRKLSVLPFLDPTAELALEGDPEVQVSERIASES